MIRLTRKVQKSLKRRGVVGTLKFSGDYMCHLLREITPSQRYLRSEISDFDLKYGVDTGGMIPLSNLDIKSDNWIYGGAYQASSDKKVSSIINELPIDYQKFLFVDLGCGKGLPILISSEFPFKKIIGIDISPQLCKVAEQNILAYKSASQKCSHIEVICMDVASFLIPNELSVFYLYNPFEEEIMIAVFENIKCSLIENPRTIYVIYYNPVLSDLLDNSGFLKRNRTGDNYIVYTNDTAMMI